MFTNRIAKTTTTECTESKRLAGESGSRWFIKMGFAGFNSPANNRGGYVSKAAAEKACLKYQSR